MCPSTRQPKSRHTRLIASLLTLLLFSVPAYSQDRKSLDDIDAKDELQELSLLLANDDVDAEALNTARLRTSEIENEAAACAKENSEASARLEEQFEPLREIDLDDALKETVDRSDAIREALDEAATRQSQCEGLVQEAQDLAVRISDRQNQLSQQILSHRTKSVLSLIDGLPERARAWPAKIREQFDLTLADGLTPLKLLWYLTAGGIVAAFFGLFLRRQFANWYRAAGGDDAPARMKYLLPKPLAEFAPLWLEGAALFAILMIAIPAASSDLAIIRAALAIFAFGLSCVTINWATGPLSPAAEVNGLIPDHVQPLRIRLRLMALALCFSYLMLGGEWLVVRPAQLYVAGRASMIFVVALSLLGVLTYLGRIPGLQQRYRAVRWVAIAVVAVAIIALLAGYQNFAGYLVQGITRTGLALFLLWILLWFFYVGFNYLIERESPTASQIRTTLGISGKGSGTGIGFMQLIADLVLWIGVIVYLIYIWDNTGSTLGKLGVSIDQGWELGSILLKPRDIVRGILIFTALVVITGWIKQWIDRRWLQRIVIERGARDAILTLFGYVAFVLAIVIALMTAHVNLSGLAVVSAALAVGLGFGLQEIANNFVSGLILLFERPIRAGDFVTVGEVEGFVRRIRIRATEIETLDNQNVLVPNSKLVSGQVTNWVLRDAHGRLQVTVGVAYGSDVERVRDILETVGREHKEVITDGRAPSPRALFMGFGDSSLDFELRVRIKRIERRFSVTSDLNFEIDKAFRDANITIPFPQRDLHIVSYPEPPQKTPLKPRDTSIESPGESHTTADNITRSHIATLDTSCDRSDIWTAITDIEKLQRWLARDGSFSPHIGGGFELNLRDGYTLNGRIDIFVPSRRMRLVILPSRQEGPLATGPVTAEFIISDVGDQKRLTVTVSGIPGSEDWEEYYRLSVDRWQEALAELKSDVLRK